MVGVVHRLAWITDCYTGDDKSGDLACAGNENVKKRVDEARE